MNRHLISLLLLLLAAGSAPAVCVLDLSGVDKEIRLEKLAGAEIGKRGSFEVPRERIDRPIDVTLYELDVNLTVASTRLDGSVDIDFETLEALPAAEFDFSNSGMNVSGVWLDGATAVYTHADELVSVELPQGTQAGETFRVRIEFDGRPDHLIYGLPSFGGGLRRTIFADANGNPDQDAPILASLSEPTAARAWWPCHDTPYDGARIRLTVTAEEGYELVAPGELEEFSDLQDGRWRHRWFFDAEVPAYLLSFVLADLESWSETATVTSVQSGQPVTMPIDNYSNNVLRSQAEHTWQNTVEMIEWFDQTISPYPYGHIKYGHALFAFAGAMEHPSISSMGQATVNSRTSYLHDGPAAEWVVAHEMIHQWFGDSLHLERWGEIWLNEGFASYGEVLWLEHKYGYDVAKQWLNDDKRRDSFATTVRDPSQAVGLFSGTVYKKGGWVLHMLRQALGDADFRESLRRYADRYRYSPVTSEDFQGVCEEVHRESGGAQLHNDSLDWFFRPWLEQHGRPELTVEWYQTDDGITLQVRQPEDRAYRLPLLVRLRFADGIEEDQTVVIDGSDFGVLLLESREVVALRLDPEDDWLLDKAEERLVGDVPAALLAPYPNPFNPSATIRYFLREPQQVELDVYDTRGRHVHRLVEGPRPAGLLSVEWDGTRDGRAVASGVYLFVLKDAKGDRYVKRASLLK